MNRLVPIAIVAFATACFAAEPLPDLIITLDEQNAGVGLAVPSGGDGVNVPVTFGGRSARRIAGDRSLYLYVVIKHPAYTLGSHDVYVTAEVFDDAFAHLSLQYDQATPPPNRGAHYARAETSTLLTGSGRWRKAHFHLPDLRFGHGQNHGADFRFVARGVAVHSITVSPRRPADFNPDALVDAESLRLIRVERPAGMELTFGNDASPSDAAVFKALSVTSVESYVHWAGVEPTEGQWDWSKWDKQVATLKAAGVKWVPFLIAGPAYATPLWFQNGPHSHVCRCLEHDKDSKVQSIFNPQLRPYVERFLKAFADRYRDSGVIESVLLGISGIYGESIYPAGPEGGWTGELTGPYHNHGGWWAGEPNAVAAFRAAMRRKYGNIATLNKAWSANHESFDSLTTFLPDKAPSARARADFVEWYQQTMTDWSVFWVKATRKVFPKSEIYLCTGGDGNPVLGADFTAQARAIAPFGAGIRITNESSDYAHNFAITREVATATRHYRTFCGFEPASGVSPTGVVARIYNATASGTRQLHYYINNVLDNAAALQNFRANATWLMPRRPHVDVSLYLSRETWALDPGAIHRLYELSFALRNIADLDFVTRRSIADGVLRNHRILILAESSVLEPDAARAIEKWVRNGGTLIAATRPGETLGDRLHDHAAWRERLFANATTSGDLLTPICADAPARWRLDVGSEKTETWLFGDWHGREGGSMWPEIANSAMRWTGSRPGVLLPTRPGADYTLRLAANVMRFALDGAPVLVRVNGQPVGKLDREGKHVFEFRVPTEIVGDMSAARLELAVKTWKPSERLKAGDKRDLGIAVRQIEWIRAGAESDSPAPAVLRFEVNRPALDALTRRVGKGKTVFLPGLSGKPTTVARVLALFLRDSVDGQLDGRFATVTHDGVLWYDATNARIRLDKR